MRIRSVAVMAFLLLGIWQAERLTKLAEEDLYNGRVVYARTTPYQRIIVTRGRSGFQLFLNGNLQFNSTDEYRYHEALVHPAMQLANQPQRILVLGGGDGLAVREILKHASVRSITLVDIDPSMTDLARNFVPLRELNQQALSDARVTIVNQDAMAWLTQNGETFDAVLIDFPDPDNFALGKLYTTHFYQKLKQRLTPNAAIALQCTSPLLARSSYWCVIRTLEASGFSVAPYHVSVPSFGEWGFALARLVSFTPPAEVLPGLRFLDSSAMATIFTLPTDLRAVPVEINRLDNQALVHYYESEWKRWW